MRLRACLMPQFSRFVSRTLSNIEDGAFCENSKWLKAINYFRKTLHLRCWTGFCISLGIGYCRAKNETDIIKVTFSNLSKLKH